MAKMEDAISFHRRIVKQALGVAWQHKHLWIFGFFAAFAGFGSVYEALLRLHDRVVVQADLLGGSLWMDYLPGLTTLKAVIAYSPSPWISAIIYSIISLLIMGIFVWVVIMALSGTISAIKAISKGKDLKFAEVLKRASSHFWKILAVILAVKAITILTSLIIGTNLFELTIGGGGLFDNLNFFLSFAIFTAIVVVVAVIGVYAITGIVDDDAELSAAIVRGWEVFRKHWLVSLEAALVVFLVQLTVMVAGVIGLLVVSVPFIFLLMVAVLLDLPVLGMVVGILAAITAVLIVAVLAAFLTVFQVSVWWQLWQEFKGKNRLVAGIERWAAKVFKIFN